jgi:hypothetical protein
MVVLLTFSAVPVVVVIVLVPVTLTVPPPVAANAGFAPVLEVRPPVKLIVAPVLVDRLMPLPLSLMAPLNSAVPPVRLLTSTDLPLPAWLVIVPV